MLHTAILASVDDEVIALLAIGGFFGTIIIAVLAGVARSVLKTRAREDTKREIAAYVAEGSITPEDAERILRSDLPRWQK